MFAIDVYALYLFVVSMAAFLVFLFSGWYFEAYKAFV